MDATQVEKIHLEVYDANKNILGILTDNTPYTAYDLSVMHTINDTSKITFSVPCKNEKSKYLINENLVKFEGEYYVIKKPILDNEKMVIKVDCEHEAVCLKDRLVGKIELIAETAGSLISRVLEGTNWIFGTTDIPNTKRRHLSTNEISVFANLVEIAQNFNARLIFSTETVNGKEIKNVSLYANPIDNGRYVRKRKDLKNINISYDSTNMVTRLYVYGRTDEGTDREVTMMAAHPKNLPYVENFSYFKDLGYSDEQIQANKDKFIKEITIRNTSLYTPQEVYEWALEEVARLCYPKVEASIDILDISVLPQYLTKPLQIGETIWVFDEDIDLILQAQVVGINKSYSNPLDITVEISNVIEKNSTLKQMVQASDIVDKIYDNSSNKINGMYIKEATIGSAQIGNAVIDKAHIKDGIIDSAKINRLSVQEAVLQDAVLGTAQIADAAITNAKIDRVTANRLVVEESDIKNAAITTAKIKDLSVTNAKINSIDAGKITTGDLSADRIKTNVISAINLSTETAKIDSAKIGNIDAGKITTGDLSADRIKTNVIEAINSYSGSATIDTAKIGDLNASKITGGDISADRLKANVISAINSYTGSATIDTAKIGDLTADKISAGDISADRIKTNVISAINAYAGTLKIKQSQIETLQVGNANITDLDASKINAGKLAAQYIDVDNITVKSANIVGDLSASKITSGTLDANKVTISNLKADNIVAGSITIEGNNLLHNSDFKEFGVWTKNTGVTIDMTKMYEGCNSVKLTGISGNLYSEFIPALQGQTFVISLKSYYESATKPAKGTLVIFEEYDSNSATRLSWQESAVSDIADSWQPYVVSRVVKNAETTRIRIRIYHRAEGVTWIAQPMLSHGSIASIWKLHNDELISSGAITTDKIKDEAVTLNKLNIDSLFVSDSAFVNELKAVEIDASQITTGKIQGDRIDIKGLISYEALDSSMQPLFSVLDGKTYINGGMLATGSIKANSLDLLSGMTVVGQDNTTTFAIADNGQVEINGVLRSGNFDENRKTGYRLTPDGNAILNQATIRGNIELPNAGMTNEYDMSQVYGRNLVRNFYSGLWNFNQTFTVVTGNKVMQTATSAWQNSYMFMQLEPNETYVVSAKTNGRVRIIAEHEVNGSNNLAIIYGQNGYEVFTTTSSGKITLRIGNADLGVGDFYYEDIKIEKGDKPTGWSPAPEDDLNPVRIWAGASAENKNDAPFRVYQNGDVYATKGNFQGTFTGRLEIGNIFIEDTNETNGSIEVWDNNNINMKAQINVNQTLFDTDLILGNMNDKKFHFVNSTRNLNMNGLDVIWTPTNGLTIIKFNNSTKSALDGLNLIATIGGGHHIIRHSSVTNKAGTLVFDSEGNQGETGDFSFTRKNYQEDVKVDVDGELIVKTSIKSKKQDIEIRSVNNEGWGFYAT